MYEVSILVLEHARVHAPYPKNAWFPALLFCKQSARNAHAHTSRHVHTIYIYTHTRIYIYTYVYTEDAIRYMHACMHAYIILIRLHNVYIYINPYIPSTYRYM